jgi:short-subunit dehydrogenase
MGLTETLRSEMAEDNIGVSVACPGLVRTNIYQGLRLRPEQYLHENVPVLSEDYIRQSKEIMSKGMDPVEFGRQVLSGLIRNDLFILTHPEFEQGIRDRFEKLLAALPNVSADVERTEIEARFTLRNKIYSSTSM